MPQEPTLPLALQNPNAVAVGAAEDMIQFFVERIIHDRSSRIECYDAIRSFWSFHPARDIEFGYHCTRIRLAELLVVGCGDAVLEPSVNIDGKCLEHKSSVNLHDWTREQWLEYLDDLKSVACLLFRKDATVELSSAENEDEMEDDTAVLCSEDTDIELEKTFDLVMLSAAVAPIRCDLEAMVMESDSAVAKVDDKRMVEFCTFADELDDHLQQICRNHVCTREPNTSNVVVADVAKIKKLMRKLSSQRMQETVEKLVIRLNLEVYGSKAPQLVELQYLPRGLVSSHLRSKKATNPLSPSRIHALRENRETLRDHVRDPLVDLVPRGNELTIATTLDTGNKKRTIQIDDGASADDDDDDDDDDSNMDNPPRLSELNPPRKKRSLQSHHRVDPAYPPDEGLFDRHGNVTTRRKFTEEEKDAIKQGVEIFGIGKWAAVKKHFQETFKNRTSVQIKDCWRTMVARQEVDPEHFIGSV